MALRKRFLAGEISVGELEIQARMSAAEKDLRETRSSIEFIRPRLEDLRAKAAAGLVPPDAVKSAELGLSAIEARAELALKQIEILKQIR